ncbi:unnamed protein product, partial [Hapterophycus canaliculatus]
QLPFEALLPAAVSAMPPPGLEAHLTLAYNALTDASAPVRRKGQTLVYLQSLAPIPHVANLLLNSTFLVVLLRLLRRARPVVIRETVATLIGLLVRHATYIAPGAGKSPSSTLGRAAQTTALRKSAVAALGELLFYVVTQEPHTPAPAPATGVGVGGVDLEQGGARGDAEAWSIPVAAVGDALR